MLPRFWVASTKPGAALARVKGSLQPLQGRGWFLAPRDRGPEAGLYCLKGHYSADLAAHQRGHAADLIRELRELRRGQLLWTVTERLFGPWVHLHDDPVRAH